MKKIYTLLIAILVMISIIACTPTPPILAKAKKIQDVQIYTTSNADKVITPETISKAFESVGLHVPANNNMNKPFKARFGKVNYKVYNLAMYMNNDLTVKLIKKYPNFGALTPLSMSIWEDKDGNMNISTLTINGMARAIGIPLTDPDLIAYATLIKKALATAMPKGHFKGLPFTVKFQNTTLTTNFVADVTLDKGETPSNFIDDFEAELEGELEPLGFLVPNYINVQEELFDDAGYTGVYDFYHTYSLCKFDVIFSVSKLHPEAGAWAPCSFFLYKKTGENKMHIGFLSVENWINTLDIKDENSTKSLRQAQGIIENIMKDITE